MIKYEQKNNYYWLYSKKNIGKFWPFEWIFVKWNFLGKSFDFNTTNLKSWKHCVWYFNWKTFLFEEIDDKLIYKK